MPYFYLFIAITSARIVPPRGDVPLCNGAVHHLDVDLGGDLGQIQGSAGAAGHGADAAALVGQDPRGVDGQDGGGVSMMQ